MTDPFTSEFGAVPKPEEPARRPEPRPQGYPQQYPRYYRAESPQGPQANAAVINNIRVGGPVRGCNHALHGTLTLLTCGMWAPVWFFAWLISTGRGR